MSGYYAVDLDGTLAMHGVDYSREVGAPIATMVARVRQWLADGQEVRIVTARMSPEWSDQENQERLIRAWCLEHLGCELLVQCHKSGGMIALYDDLAVGVVPDQGILLHDLHHGLGRYLAEQEIKNYDEKFAIESDPYVTKSDEFTGSAALTFVDGTDREDTYLTVREARVLAARLLKVADEIEKLT